MTVEDRAIAGRYDLVELVGSGGMADVHRATDRVLRRDVAVKLLRATASGTTERARFADEARTLATLNHPGLVTILDAGIEDEHPYLVMELVDGPTLGKHLRANGPLDSGSVRNLGSQLAEALAYAHARGVVHRDVKPGNILLRPDGRTVLTDFGIARLVADTDHHTRTGEVIGSPAYLAPEQVNGALPGTAVDVYSLGLVLLEALTGTRAYPGSPVEAAIARLTTPPAIPMSLDRDLRHLLVTMTALTPDDRPSAAEVADALDRGEVSGAAATLVHQGPVLPVRRASRRANRRSSRRRTGLVAAAVLVAVVLAGAGLAQLRPGRVEATPTGTPTATPSPSPTPTARAAVATTPAPAVPRRTAPTRTTMAPAGGSGPKAGKSAQHKQAKGKGRGHPKK
ncbi:MAG: pknB 3 [Marmoricola sp.]|nr:pknB 3 [Marmoricola sp.]